MVTGSNHSSALTRWSEPPGTVEAAKALCRPRPIRRQVNDMNINNAVPYVSFSTDMLWLRAFIQPPANKDIAIRKCKYSSGQNNKLNMAT